MQEYGSGWGVMIASAALALAFAAPLACGEPFSAEVYVNPSSPLMIQEQATLTVVSRFPPKDAVYRWRTDLGVCIPQESADLTATYMARRPGTEWIRLEVLSEGTVVLERKVKVEILAPRPTEHRQTVDTPVGGPAGASPTIHITQVPLYDEAGGGDRFARIAGHVSGPDPEQWQVVLYACTNVCYVQPWIEDPYTAIQPNGQWSNRTFLGADYVALLVERGFAPNSEIPRPSHPIDGVVARRIAAGQAEPAP